MEQALASQRSTPRVKGQQAIGSVVRFRSLRESLLFRSGFRVSSAPFSLHTPSKSKRKRILAIPTARPRFAGRSRSKLTLLQPD
jgi:hypothetical protein